MFGLIMVLGSVPSRAADEVDIAVDAFAIAGPAVGVSIGGEKELVKSLVRCVVGVGVRAKPIPDCARDEVIHRLPQQARPYAQCLVVERKPVEQCAASGVVSNLPPQARKIAECIATRGDVAQCGRNFAMDQLGQAEQTALRNLFATLDKLKTDQVARNPLTDTPGSVQNIIRVAEGIRDKNWGKVAGSGGREVAKAVAKTVVRTVLPPPIATTLDPAVDTLVEERFDIIEGIIAATWAGDTKRLGELYVESYILTGTPFGQGLQAACSLIPEGGVKELTCGSVGKVLSWVTDAGSDVAGGIGDVAEDVGLALGGNQCKAAPYF